MPCQWPWREREVVSGLGGSDKLWTHSRKFVVFTSRGRLWLCRSDPVADWDCHEADSAPNNRSCYAATPLGLNVRLAPALPCLCLTHPPSHLRSFSAARTHQRSCPRWLAVGGAREGARDCALVLVLVLDLHWTLTTLESSDSILFYSTLLDPRHTTQDTHRTLAFAFATIIASQSHPIPTMPIWLMRERETDARHAAVTAGPLTRSPAASA